MKKVSFGAAASREWPEARPDAGTITRFLAQFSVVETFC